MFAVLTLDNDDRPTEHATARTYSVALAHADELLSVQSYSGHSTVIIAWKYPSEYQPLVTLKHRPNAPRIPHDGPPEEYTTTRFVYGRSLTFKASHKAVYVDVYQNGKAIDTISAYDYKADKSRLDNPKTFHEIVDLYTVQVNPNYMDTIAY